MELNGKSMWSNHVEDGAVVNVERVNVEIGKKWKYGKKSDHWI